MFMVSGGLINLRFETQIYQIDECGRKQMSVKTLIW